MDMTVQLTVQDIVSAQDERDLTLADAAELIRSRAAFTRSLGAPCEAFDLAVEVVAALQGLGPDQSCGIVQLVLQQEKAE